MGCWGLWVVFIQERAQRLAEEKERFRLSHRCLGPVPMYEQFVLKAFGWYHIPAVLVHFVPKMPVRHIDNIDSVHLVNSVELGSNMKQYMFIISTYLCMFLHPYTAKLLRFVFQQLSTCIQGVQFENTGCGHGRRKYDLFFKSSLSKMFESTRMFLHMSYVFVARPDWRGRL